MVHRLVEFCRSVANQFQYIRSLSVFGLLFSILEYPDSLDRKCQMLFQMFFSLKQILFYVEHLICFLLFVPSFGSPILSLFLKNLTHLNFTSIAGRFGSDSRLYSIFRVPSLFHVCSSYCLNGGVDYFTVCSFTFCLFITVKVHGFCNGVNKLQLELLF